MHEIESEYLRGKVEFQPWLEKPQDILDEQAVIHDILRRHAGAKHIGRGCFIAKSAKIYTDHLSIGDASWIAAGAILRGHITLGKNCSINPFSHIAGKVVIGDGARIAGMVSIYGFNHGYSRTDIPIYQQTHTSIGIDIGAGCWIGANAVIVDGVKIGAHSIVAGGAVVTSDFPEYSIVGGCPARLIKCRL
jgi:acetyltransferase-like isoleucine patch superfamily enzyme